MFFVEEFVKKDKPNLTKYTLDELKSLHGNILECQEELNKKRVNHVKQARTIEKEISGIENNLELVANEIKSRTTNKFNEKINELIELNPEIFNSNEIEVIKKQYSSKTTPDKLEYIFGKIIKIKAKYPDWKLKVFTIWADNICEISFVDEENFNFGFTENFNIPI